MRLQGWLSLTTDLAAGLVSSAPWRLTAAAAANSQKHVCPLSQRAASMAEEAKKLAAYAAVDNHVQVESAADRVAVGQHTNSQACLFSSSVSYTSQCR